MTRSASALAILAAVGLPGTALGSGYEFEGVGARQVSRAGAAIADAEDWSAAYWNPANIVRAAQKTGAEIGLEAFGGMAHLKDSNSLSTLSAAGVNPTKQNLDSGYLLGALGGLFPVGPSVAVGFAVYTPLLQGVDFHDVTPAGNDFRYRSSLGLITSNASASVAFSPEVSAGIGIDLLYAQLKSDIQISNFAPLFGANTTSHASGDGVGAEGVFGLRYDPIPALSLGAVYRTGSNIPIHGQATAASSNPVPLNESARFTYILRHPPTTGVGLAWRPSSRWTLSTDFDQTYWKGFGNDVDYAPSGALLSSTKNTFHWRDTWKVRAGARFAATARDEILAGYSYDRPAVDPGSLDLSTTLDVYMHRFYGGFSHRWSSRFENVIGTVIGVGNREEQGVSYRVSGWQLMAEARIGLGGPSQ